MTTLTADEIVSRAAEEVGPLGVELHLRHGGDQLVGRLAERRFEKPLLVKRHISPATAVAIHEQVNRVAGPDAVLATHRVTPQVAQILRSLGRQFVDATGNVFLHGPGVLVWHLGRPAEFTSPVPPTQVAAGVSGAALKVQFGLLVRPELANEPLREIAAATLTSVGSAQAAMKALDERGHLVRRSDRRLVVDRPRLLDEWVPLYLRTLAPKLVLGRYVGDSMSWWRSAALPADAQWGGEVAAAKQTAYLRPQTAVIYVDTLSSRLLTMHRLRRAAPDDHVGVVEVRRRFWRQEALVSDPADTVPPLLTYADLLAIADARAVEVAGRIRDERLTAALAES